MPPKILAIYAAVCNNIHCISVEVHNYVDHIVPIDCIIELLLFHTGCLSFLGFNSAVQAVAAIAAPTALVAVVATIVVVLAVIYVLPTVLVRCTKQVHREEELNFENEDATRVENTVDPYNNEYNEIIHNELEAACQ